MLSVVPWCIMVIPIPPTANGDLPKGLRTVVAATSTGKVISTTIGHGYYQQHYVKSPPGRVSVRSYCHGVCESSYNQLQVDDTIFIPNNDTCDIVSGHHPNTVTHERVSFPDCDPLTATFDKKPNIIVYILCHSGPQISNELTVFGVLQQSVSWSVTDPYTCFLNDAVMVDDVGMFFYGIDGRIYVAFASSAGLGVCSLKSDIPSFIAVPTSCPYIAKLSLFDPVNILVECTSGKDSQWVDAVWLFSIRDSKFTQRLPQQDYDVGQIVFSDNRLISATWRDMTVTLTKLSKSNPPSATVVAKGNVDSAHIVGTGSTSQLVVVAKGGVQQYDLHAVFGGSTEAKTLEGSEDVLTHFDDPSCPTAQVVDQCVVIPTRRGTTYGMALLPLNGDKPEVIPGVRPARFAVYPGVNITNPTEPTEAKVSLVGVYAGISAGVVVVILTVTILLPIVLSLSLLAAIQRRRRRRNK